MDGSYKLDSFTKNWNAEVKRLGAQVNLFFEKEFALYSKLGLSDGMDIIECGSGPGFLIRNIVERFPNSRATALEIDDYLFEVLEENSISGEKRLYKPINESIYDTKFPDNCFDFIITRLVIEHLEKPLSAIYELRRILKPGGKLVVVSNDFAYHLLTYPVIPELDEMYNAYCKSRFSEGGNPMIGRQMPVYLEESGFENIDFNVLTAHNKMSGDKAFLDAENVNISKSLVEAGFLHKDTLANLVDKWFKMLSDPGHVIYRQLFVISGVKTINSIGEYEKDIELRLKGNSTKSEPQQTNKIDEHRARFRKIMSRGQQGTSANIIERSQENISRRLEFSENMQKNNMVNYDQNQLENILLELWKEVLKNDTISMDDNFFDIGGDSVLIPEMVDSLSENQNIRIRIIDLFEFSTIKQLSEHILESYSEK